MSDSESTRSSIPMLLMTAVLAFLGIHTFTSDSATPSSKEPKASEERAAPGQQDEGDESARSSDRFWQPLLEYRDTKINDDFLREIEQLRMHLPDLDQGELRCLIACVPHPFESSSKDRFDGLIDAIQRAAETQGYVYDRSFYPWRKPERKTSQKEGTGGALTEQKSMSLRHTSTIEQKSISLRFTSASQGGTDPQSHQPGVLLLRAPLPRITSCVGLLGLSSPAAGNWAAAAVAPMLSPRLLLLLLVGETATAGLDKKAFMAALHLISQSPEYQLNHQVNVLGPHFSGSQTSLEKITRAWGITRRSDKQRRRSETRTRKGRSLSLMNTSPSFM